MRPTPFFPSITASTTLYKLQSVLDSQLQSLKLPFPLRTQALNQLNILTPVLIPKITHSSTQLQAQLFDINPVLTVNFNRQDPSIYIDNQSKRKHDSEIMANIYSREFLNFISNPENRDAAYVDVNFSDTFFGTRRALQFLHTPAEIFRYYFTMADIVMPTIIDQLLNTSLQFAIPFFSHMKRFIHRHIDSLPSIAFMYSELDTIAGYPKEEHRVLNEDPKQWLTDDVPDQHDSKWWFNQIYCLLLSNAHIREDRLLSFIEFVSSPWLWITPGASRESKLFLNGHRVATKFGAALSLTVEQLLICVVNAVKPNTLNLDIFVKPDERGYKRRLIANLDLGSYLIAAYIRYLIQYIDGLVPRWMTATTQPAVDQQVFRLLQRCQRAIPLDESSFDHHVSRAAWLGLIEALNVIFPNNVGVCLFTLLFMNTKYIDINTGIKWSWKKGMPSGLALTAMCNTLFNYIKQQPIQSPIHWALGDDALLFNETIQLNTIESYYDTFGAEVNANKNWESRKFAEYLHFLYFPHGRTGYPARIYGSLMYAMRFNDITPLVRINEIATLFKDFYDRALLHMNEKFVAADLSRAVSTKWIGFSATQAMQWLHIPKALNGFGKLPYNYAIFKVKTESTEIQTYENALYNLKPVRIPKKTSFSIFPYKFKVTNYRVGPPLHMPPIENLDQWIARLNLDSSLTDTHMADLGLIPLPVVDFVSTNKMSDFAQQWSFNYYPNHRGNRISQTNRLISASVGLVSMVLQWMTENKLCVYV